MKACQRTPPAAVGSVSPIGHEIACELFEVGHAWKRGVVSFGTAAAASAIETDNRKSTRTARILKGED